MSDTALLTVNNLAVEFATENGVVRAVDDVSFEVRRGETLGIVGESGCGKTVTGLAVMRLIPTPPGRIVAGSIELEGRDLRPVPEKAMRDIRGRDIAMIFQEPMTALNPVFTIGSQMIDVIRRHQLPGAGAARQRALEMLGKVGIPIPDQRLDEYPHQLSGGMRQRIMIAMALSCSPRLLIADEPTTALDVTTQAQVMEYIVGLQRELGMAMMLITHDLGVIAESCRRALVMYCGKLIEDAPIEALFARPQHPYTQGLLRSIPRIRERPVATLPVIEGTVPDLSDLPPGCRFADRCPRVRQRCRASQPPLIERDGARVACFYPGPDNDDV